MPDREARRRPASPPGACRQGRGATPDFWIRWGALAAVICLAQVFTLHLSPTIHPDEVVILDHGRVALFEPATDWSVNLRADGRPLLTPYVVGVGLQEAAYRLLAPARIGPRLSSLLGAVLAATLCIVWLRGRGAAALPALLGGTALLLDPLLAYGYRIGRLDAWAMACCLAAACLLQSAARLGRTRSETLRLAGAGAAAALAPLVWPSAILLYPLLAAEWSSPLPPAPLPDPRPGPPGRPLLAFAAGAAGVLVLGGLLLAPRVAPMLDGLGLALRGNLQLSSGRLREELIQWGPFLRDAAPSGWLFLAGFAAALLRRERRLALALGLALAVILLTMAYAHRLVYLLPYLVGLLAGAAHGAGPNGARLPRLATAALAAAVAWAGLVTLAVRPAVALSQREGRDASRLLDTARRHIGAGPFAIYADTRDFYFAGRALGWRQYNVCWGDHRERRLDTLLAGADFAIVAADREGSYLRAQMARAGLRLTARLLGESSSAPREPPLLGLATGSRPYGPYLLFGRAPVPRTPAPDDPRP